MNIKVISSVAIVVAISLSTAIAEVSKNDPVQAPDVVDGDKATTSAKVQFEVVNDDASVTKYSQTENQPRPNRRNDAVYVNDDDDEDLGDDVEVDIFLIGAFKNIEGKQPSSHANRLPKSYDVLILEEVEREKRIHSGDGNSEDEALADEEEQEQDDDNLGATSDKSYSDKLQTSFWKALCSGGLASPDFLLGLMLFIVIGLSLFFVARRAYIKKFVIKRQINQSSKFESGRGTHRTGYAEIPSPSAAKITEQA